MGSDKPGFCAVVTFGEGLGSKQINAVSNGSAAPLDGLSLCDCGASALDTSHPIADQHGFSQHLGGGTFVE